MKIFILIIIFFSLIVTSFSQENKTFLYSHYYDVVLNDSGKLDYSYTSFGALYVKGDSLAIYRLGRQQKDLFNKLDINKKESHHTIIKYLKKNEQYEVIHWPIGTNCLLKYGQDTTKWDITNDTVTIMNTKCIKAKSNEATAWFAPSLPIAFGPLNHNGLPGLVFKLVNIKYKILIEMSEIRDSIPEIILDTKMKVVIWEEFFKTKK